MNASRRIYLDHAATTPLDPRVKEAMDPFLTSQFGNPSSLYKEGLTAKRALDDARSRVAVILGGHADEIIFAGSGTESINLAIQGVVRREKTPAHIITSAIEHHAVLNCVDFLKKQGWEITYLTPDEFGRISVQQVSDAIKPNTVLVSLMYANNEIGTINPIADIGRELLKINRDRTATKLPPVLFHTDACQAAEYLDLDVRKLHVDLLTLNGSKIYGPKGVGLLFVRRGVRLTPLVFGGGQERNLRSGTENMAGIMGLARALELSREEKENESARLSELRDQFIEGIMKSIPKVVLNGHPTERLPNNVNVSILDIEGEALLLYMDAQGIAAATGSACDSAQLEPSHVILGIGRPYEYAHGSIRFTLGRETTKENIAYVLSVLPALIEKLRKISAISISLTGDNKEVKKEMGKAFVDLGRPHWEKKYDKAK